MTGPQKYTKKSVEIEAMEWAVEGGASPIIDWILENGGRASYQCEGLPCTGRPQDHSILIHTLEGDMKASFGDFVIRGVKGEFYPCKPDIFRAIHEMPGDADTLNAIDEDTIEAVASAIGLSARIVPGRPWSAFDVEDQDQHRSEATAAIEALMKRGWTP